MSDDRNAKVMMAWSLLAPYIASEDPPDLSDDDQAEILTANALPQVWQILLDLEIELVAYENDETARRRHDLYKINRLKAFAELVRDFFTNDSAGHASYLLDQAGSALADAEHGDPRVHPDDVIRVDRTV